MLLCGGEGRRARSISVITKGQEANPVCAGSAPASHARDTCLIVPTSMFRRLAHSLMTHDRRIHRLWLQNAQLQKNAKRYVRGDKAQRPYHKPKPVQGVVASSWANSCQVRSVSLCYCFENDGRHESPGPRSNSWVESWGDWRNGCFSYRCRDAVACHGDLHEFRRERSLRR